MDPKDRESPNLGKDNEALEVNSDIEYCEDVRPFTPPLDSENNPYIPEGGAKRSKSGTSRLFGDGFREIEICPHIRKKGNKVHPMNNATSSVHIISELEDVQTECAQKENRKEKEEALPENDGQILFQSRQKARKTDEDRILQKRSTDQEKMAKTSEVENVSSKYGVTMSVKSGVKRTPWHSSSNGSNGEGSSKEGSGGSTRLMRKSTEETILASSSSSANSFLSSHQKFQPETSGTMSVKEQEGKNPDDGSKPIPTISGTSESREQTNLTPISLATYHNIQKEGIPKRGNCILCFTATLTFIVTLVLTVAILIAPKTFATKEEPPPPAILDHISGVNILLKNNRKTAELSFSAEKVKPNSSSVNYDFFSNFTNYTEALPNR